MSAAKAVHGLPRGPLTEKKVRKQADRIFRFLFPRSYPGEVFLCGGAFKPALHPKLRTNDIDLWVRDRKERNRLLRFLLERGATLDRDFHPFCIRLLLDGCAVEITYHNIKKGTIKELVHGFDIAGCAIGARYSCRRLREVYISPGAHETIATGEVLLEEGYLRTLVNERLPTVLRGIDRMQSFADETGLRVRERDMETLWKIYLHNYTVEEQRKCVDVYLETTVGFKQGCNKELLQRATTA
ncbi:MAG: hypothetical protein AAGJ79_03575 [Verrucomicrobiota bacterium]